MGKHPRIKFWQREASVDPDRIRRWWVAWPDANIGILTGAGSGLVVVDIDAGGAGFESWRELQREHEEAPETPAATTGSGGAHLYYRHPGRPVRNKVALAPGIDIRADGGFVVAPPSRNAAGPYEWREDFHPSDTIMEDLPGFVEELAGRRNGVAASPVEGKIFEHTRSSTLISLGGSMRRRGMEEEEIAAALLVMNKRRCDPPLEESEVLKIARSAASYDPEPPPPVLRLSRNGHAPTVGPEGLQEEQEGPRRMVCMADVVAEDVDWLWEGFIARRKFALWEGDPGIGKTFALLAIGAAITSGRPLPGGRESEPATVMMFTVEDDLPDTIRPRLDALGADLLKFHADEEPLTIDAEGLAYMDREMTRLKPALVIIDPLFAYVGGKINISRPNEIRVVTTPLRQLAKKHNCGIVGIRHLTKEEKRKAIQRGSGGMDWVAASRLVVLVGNDPERAGRKVIVRTKSNLNASSDAVAFTLSPEEGFRWEGSTAMTAEKLLSGGPQGDDEASKMEEARAFLEEILAEGPVPAREVKKQAGELGIASITLQRARYHLGIVPRSRYEPGKRGAAAWWWSLPDPRLVMNGSKESDR